MSFFEFFIPTKVFFGINRIDTAGDIIKKEQKGSNIALLYDDSDWMQPLYNRIIGSIKKAKLDLVASYSGIHPNPKLSECKTGLEIIRKAEVEVCVVIGGGSYLDAAKWIVERSDCRLFIAIPTTAGTGSEINEWAVITDDETHVKNSIQCRAADITLLDPTATVLLPPTLTLFSGMDAFSHGMEAYLSKNASPLTDMLAYAACKKIIENMETCIEDGNNLTARSELLEASVFAGAAMLNAGLGILHCISNLVPGFFPQYSHGYVCGSLIIPTLEFNKNAVTEEKYAHMYPLAVKADRILKQSMKQNGIGPLVLEEEKLSTLVRYAATNVNRHSNPRAVTPENVERLIREQFTIGRCNGTNRKEPS